MSGNDNGRDRSSGDPSFEDRLRAAREKQGLGTPRTSPADGAAPSAEPSPMGVGLRVGVELVSALAVAVAIGWGLDRWLHTMPAFLVVFVFLGGLAGVANVWRLMGPKKTPR